MKLVRSFCRSSSETSGLCSFFFFPTQVVSYEYMILDEQTLFHVVVLDLSTGNTPSWYTTMEENNHSYT